MSEKDFLDSFKHILLPEYIFANIEKTHQPPKCKVCKKPFPRLNQRTMICNNCEYNKGKTLDKWF